MGWALLRPDRPVDLCGNGQAMKGFTTIRLQVTFPSDDVYLVRRRLQTALERLEPARIVTWFPDPVRCFSCNQPESEEVRIRDTICDGCRQEQEPVA